MTQNDTKVGSFKSLICLKALMRDYLEIIAPRLHRATEPSCPTLDTLDSHSLLTPHSVRLRWQHAGLALHTRIIFNF